MVRARGYFYNSSTFSIKSDFKIEYDALILKILNFSYLVNHLEEQIILYLNL